MSDADIIDKPVRAVDTECYRNYWQCQFLELDGTSHVFELYPDAEWVDTRPMRKLLRESRLYSFNGYKYDMPMIFYALKLIRDRQHTMKEMCLLLKSASDAIIVGGSMPWEISNERGFEIPAGVDHIDLFEVSPGPKTSLKLYAGRMHTPTMEDLPYKPSMIVKPEMREHLVRYCRNDCYNTLLLANKLKEQIELREVMTEKYGIDLRSKSDAQIAEAVIKQAVCKSMKVDRIQRPTLPAGWSFKYEAPLNIEFKTPALQQLLEDIKALDFRLSDKGSPIMPKGLAGRIVEIGGRKYQMGMGGLHSMEKAQTVKSTDTITVKDRDVTSYYPWIIIRNALYPKQMGTHFLNEYSSIVMERVRAKLQGDKTKADTFKIIVNGSFGKLGSRFSALFAPDLMIEVTVSGQLYLLMFIERMVIADIEVVSANTDGVVFLVPKGREEEVKEIIREWERDTGLETEETVYVALHSRDVNNYCALYRDKTGNIKVKSKGVFAETGLMKNPNNPIIATSVRKFLEDGTPIEKTIRDCDDIRQFVKVITVNTGGSFRGEYIGKVVRFYKQRGHAEPIRNAKGDKVQLSEGACPIMTLPDEFPDDIDYAWYEREAYDLIREVGMIDDRWFLFDGWF